MFGDEMPCAGVKRPCEEGGEDKVVERVEGRSLDEDVVEQELSEDVEEVDWCEGDFVDEYRADGVEEDLEGAEERFA